MPNSAFSGGSRLHANRQVAVCFCHFPKGNDGARQVWADQPHTLCLALWFVLPPRSGHCPGTQKGDSNPGEHEISLPTSSLQTQTHKPFPYLNGFYWNSHHSSLPWIPRAFALSLNEDLEPTWRKGIVNDASLMMERELLELITITWRHNSTKTVQKLFFSRLGLAIKMRTSRSLKLVWGKHRRFYLPTC